MKYAIFISGVLIEQNTRNLMHGYFGVWPDLGFYFKTVLKLSEVLELAHMMHQESQYIYFLYTKSIII